MSCVKILKEMKFQILLEDLKKSLDKGDNKSLREKLLLNSHLFNHGHSLCSELDCIEKKPEVCKRRNKKIVRLIDFYPEFLKTKRNNIDLRKYFTRAIFRGHVQAANVLLIIETSEISENLFTEHDIDKEQAIYVLGEVILASKPEDQDIIELAKIFLDCGILENREVYQRYYPLMMAVGVLHVPLVAYLLDRGLPVNSNGFMSSHNILVFAMSNYTLMDLLLSRGADINRGEGRALKTVLHLACEKNDEKLIRYFINNGADLSKTTEDGATPFDLLKVKSSNYDQCVRTIVKQVVKMTFDGKTVSETNLEFIRTKLLAEDIDNCLAELKMMSETQFYTSHTFYSTMNGSLTMKKLAAFAKNEELASKFENYLQGLVYFKEDLQDVWDEAILIRNTLMEIESRLRYGFVNLLPDLVIKKLVKNLSLEDLPIS